MRTRDWLEAHAAGAVRHEWAELDLTDGVNHVRLRVSADGPRVRGVRHGAGAEATQQLADAMGALMTTSRLREMRHLASSVIIEPVPLHYTSPAERHSELVDVRIQGAAPWEGWGRAAAQGKALEQLTEVDECVALYGPRSLTWMVSNYNKGFVRDPKNTATHGTNDGWIVHESQVMWRDGKAWWTRSPYRLEHEGPMGIPVYPCESIPGFYKVQPRANAHGHHQDDYASAPELVHGRCQLNGANAPTAILYTDARYAGLVFHDGNPVKAARHPGVELYVPEVASAPPPSSEPETEPRGTSTWLTPALTPRERQLAWMLAHEGLAEHPLGSNTGADIEVFDAICVRDGQPNFGAWLSKVPNDWCASCCSYSAHITKLPGDPAMPFKARASVKELKDDATAAGHFIPMADIVSGKVVPQPGWKVIWPRFDPGTRTIGWRGHVDTLVRMLVDSPSGKLMAEVIGGNVGHKITRRVIDLLAQPLPATGMIRIPEHADAGAESDAPAASKETRGVDISHHQPPATLDWPRLAQDFDWVIARACYGTKPDRHFVEHVRQARAHRLRVGAYTFVRQTQGPESQLDAFRAQLEAAGFGEGDIAPVLDLESNQANGDGPVDARLGVAAWAMTQDLFDRFGEVIIYTERDVWKQLGSPAWMLERPIWTSWPSYLGDDPWPHDEWAIWQHHHGKGMRYPERLDQNVALRLPLITEDE